MCFQALLEDSDGMKRHIRLVYRGINWKGESVNKVLKDQRNIFSYKRLIYIAGFLVSETRKDKTKR